MDLSKPGILTAPFRLVRYMYDKTLALSEHPKAAWWLAIISFMESSFFPIPPDVLLLPLCLANRKKAMKLAFICTMASIAGGVLGYLIGAYAFDSIGQSIIGFYGAEDKYETFRSWYENYGGAVVFIAGLTPIPYKVITISSGVFAFSMPQFLLLSLAARGLRFGLEGLLVRHFGESAMVIIDRHFNKLTILGAVLLVGGFLVIKLLLPQH